MKIISGPHFSRVLCLFMICAAAIAAGCFVADEPPSSTPVTEPVREERPIVSLSRIPFGNPSQAGHDPDNYLVVGKGSVFSYNNRRGTVNWVAWLTTPADLGNSIPRPDFAPDSRLPSDLKAIGFQDYSGSGYDRGHLVPSADRFGDPERNRETFLMTNIVPQTPALNRYPWERFESYVRSQVRRRGGQDAYQIAGCYGDKGVLKGRVTIPERCWKIVLLLPRGEPIEAIDRSTTTIAVDMPNIDGIEDHGWERYRTSIRAIEERSGLNFFSHLSPELQDRLETTIQIRSPQR